jgi:hypothetical protein
VTARALFKHSIAGLLLLGMLLQACLIALQLAMLVAPASSEAAFAVICTAHGAVTLDSADVPTEHGPGCVHCPLCTPSGTAALATPVIVTHAVVFAIARAWILIIASDDRSPLTLGLPPPGRGPPV